MKRTLTQDTAVRVLLSYARGTYQRALIRGDEAWSSSSLVGKARQFSGRYRASADALIQRFVADGIEAKRENVVGAVNEAGARRRVQGLAVRLDDGSRLWISHKGYYILPEDEE